jgi:hypothetical protein
MSLPGPADNHPLQVRSDHHNTTNCDEPTTTRGTDRVSRGQADQALQRTRRTRVSSHTGSVAS